MIGNHIGGNKNINKPEQHHIQVRIKTRGSLHEQGIVITTLSCHVISTTNLNIELGSDDSPVEIWTVCASDVALDVHLTGRWVKSSSINELSSSSTIDKVITQIVNDDVLMCGGNKRVLTDDAMLSDSIIIDPVQADDTVRTAIATRKRIMSGDDSHTSKVKYTNYIDDDGLIEGHSGSSIVTSTDITDGVMIESVEDAGGGAIAVKKSRKSSRKGKVDGATTTKLPNDINTKKLWKVSVENDEGKHYVVSVRL